MDYVRTGGNIHAVLFCLVGYFDLYDMVRSLSTAGIHPVVASRDRHDIAFFSRFCARKVVLLAANQGGDPAILDILKELSLQSGERPVLYYSGDVELSFLVKYRRELGQYYRFLLPPDDLIEQLFDKASFSLISLKHNLPIPHSIILNRMDPLAPALASVRYPCIVKPAYQSDWTWETEDQRRYFGWYKQALRRINSESQLSEFINMLPARPHRIVVQSYLDGADDTIASFHGYFDENSNCLGSFMGRKIRTYPPFTGGSAYIRTILNDELRRLSIGYLQRIGHRGIVKIDYKWDRIEKEYKILEMNTRYNLWEVVGTHAGVNLMSIAFDHQTGRKTDTEPLAPYPDNIRLLFFKMDLRSYLTGYRKTGEWSFGSYLRSIMSKSHYRVFNAGDPFPAVVSCARFVLRMFKRMAAAISK